MVILPEGVHRIDGENFAIDPAAPHIRYFPDLDQGSDAWLAARCGILTASEIKLILTPTLKPANNDKTRAHVWELLAQRISGHVEPRFLTDDMLRGHEDEIHARAAYEAAYGPMQHMGFITNHRHGFTIGYSPDGLIGARGLWECKSRAQKYQVQTIAEHLATGEAGEIPVDFLLQVQTGLLVSERDWLDFTSYSGGLPMATIRVYPDEAVQSAILEAAADFETRLANKLTDYRAALASGARLIPTERRVEQEISI
jgi:hypothetical protein